jgi:hypothetical protein
MENQRFVRVLSWIDAAIELTLSFTLVALALTFLVHLVQSQSLEAFLTGLFCAGFS